MIYPSEMKLRIIIVIVALGLGLGWVQRSRFAKLQAETRILGSQVAKLASRISPRENVSLSQAMAHRTTRESDPAAVAHMEAIIAISVRNIAIAETWRNPATRTPEVTAAMKDSFKNEPAEMWPHFAKLNHRQVLELIGRLQGSPRIPAMDKPRIPQVCVERLVETNAAEALQLILKLEDLPDRERYLTRAFGLLAVENPGEAVRWFDELSKQGEPVTQSPEMLESMMLAEARYDPARAVSGFLSSAEKAPDSVTLLGAKLASELRNAGEHQALLVALRSVHAKESSPVLAKIRSQYVANLAVNMRGWPVEEATALMDAEFASAEKITASQLISPGGLAEADRWATWFSEIKVPVDAKHPLVNFVGSWVQNDAVAAGNWLDQAPPGDLRNRAIVQYATLGADADPAHAARLLITVPESPERDVLLNRVVAHWKAKDRSAAAAFVKEHDICK
jgi:hypothetical protein